MIDLVIDARKKDLGGFEVGRVLPFHKRRTVCPFIFLDHMGPADFAPDEEGLNVRPQPHIGLSTVNYLCEGEAHHHDSLGNSQVIRPGEVNWMTAGKGIAHSERPDPDVRARGVRMHGMQAWVALPTENEDDAPSFANHGPDDLPSYEHGGLFARLIAGEAFGAKAKVRTHSPLFYVHWEMQAGTEAALPAEYPERAAYVAKGAVEVEGRTFHAGQMMVFAPGQTVVFKASQPSTVMLLGGEPIGPRLIWWNFVASTQDRLDAAKADWKAGRFVLPPDDKGEFIPLPEETYTGPMHKPEASA